MKFHKSPITKGLVLSAAGSMILFQAGGFSLTSVDAQQKSSIQEELEKLYQQEGRQAPNMELKTLPKQTLDGRVFQEAAEPGKPPVAISPGSPTPTRQTTSATQTTAQPVVEKSADQPAPRKRGLLNNFDKLMFWKKKDTEPSSKNERVVESPQRNRYQAPNQPNRTEYQPPLAPAAEDYPPTRYQRPIVNQPAANQPRTLPTAQPSAPIYSARPFPSEPTSRPKPLPSDPNRRTVILPAQPSQSGELPTITPYGQSTPPQTQPAPTRTRVVNDIPRQHPLTTPTSTKALPPAPVPFDASEQAAQPMAVTPPAVNQTPEPRPMPTVEQPVAQQPMIEEEAPQSAPTSASKLPSLDELPPEPLPIGPEEKPMPKAESPMVDEFFPDPFTEISEDEADGTAAEQEIPEIRMDTGNPTPQQPIPEENAPALPQPEEQSSEIEKPMPTEEATSPGAEQQLLEDENPFSGLKLEPNEPAFAQPVEELKPEPETAPELPSLEEPSSTPELPELNSEFEDDYKLPLKKEDPTNPMPELPKLEKVPDVAPQLPAQEQGGDISWEEEEARRTAKLDLIAAREGETGMKGFCIVELRDNRDLVDALPSFRSTYNLRTYHFSSLEAKIEFDKEPRKYVPAYDGNDPILLSTQSDEREGSLDHALWFKGRLYLFTSQENQELFQRDPVLYAEN
ncbi:MAG: hypothetical protein HUJ26_02595 [Planctomycetaceae bacterium]|nr:hypothetical protein [Planctomycetaceae bacterium]